MNIEKIKQPLHKSLTEEITFAGVPRNVMIIIGGLAAFSAFIFNTLYLLPLNVILYIASIWMTQFDAQFFDVIRRYMQTKKHYHV